MEYILWLHHLQHLQLTALLVQVFQLHRIQDVVTVVKAYSAAVGAGAFVSEIFGDEADELRNAAVMAASSVLQQDVQEEWDGLTVLHPIMVQYAGNNRCCSYSTRCIRIS